MVVVLLFCFVFIQWLIVNILFFRSLRAEKRSFNPLSHLALLDASSPEGGAFWVELANAVSLRGFVSRSGPANAAFRYDPSR